MLYLGTKLPIVAAGALTFDTICGQRIGVASTRLDDVTTLISYRDVVKAIDHKMIVESRNFSWIKSRQSK